VLALPVHSDLKAEEIEYVAGQIRGYFEQLP
jgi:hypothetical protein